MARAQRIAACGKQTFDRVVTDGPVAVGPLGLVGSVEYHRSARFTLARRKEDAGDRALLVQTTEHTRAIETYAASTPLKKPLGAQTAGEWGENLLASGERFDSAHVCVGDELAVVRDGTPTGVRLRATSPRLPCSKVDQKFGGTFTARGVRAQCARTGWGGIFLRVLEGGSVQAGDDLQLVARPHPTWSLKRVSELLYGDESAVMKYGKRGGARTPPPPRLRPCPTLPPTPTTTTTTLPPPPHHAHAHAAACSTATGAHRSQHSRPPPQCFARSGAARTTSSESSPPSPSSRSSATARNCTGCSSSRPSASSRRERRCRQKRSRSRCQHSRFSARWQSLLPCRISARTEPSSCSCASPCHCPLSYPPRPRTAAPCRWG